MGKGLGLGLPGWVTPPEGLPPALKAIDLRVVDDMLGNATWVSYSCGGLVLLCECAAGRCRYVLCLYCCM